MTKPLLPPCSVESCRNAAGAIIEDMLFCGEHASEALKKLIADREHRRERGPPSH